MEKVAKTQLKYETRQFSKLRLFLTKIYYFCKRTLLKFFSILSRDFSLFVGREISTGGGGGRDFLSRDISALKG